MLNRSLLILAAILCIASFAIAKRAPNRTYVESRGGGGVFYARCTPDNTTGPAGRMEIYRVKKEGDQLIDKYDFYPNSVHLAWSPIKGKVAALAVMMEPEKDRNRKDELRFCFGGQVLKSYTTDDLLKLGAEAEVTSTDGRAAAYRIIGADQIPGTNEYDFVIQLKNRTLRIDITTGEVRMPAEK